MTGGRRARREQDAADRPARTAADLKKRSPHLWSMSFRICLLIQSPRYAEPLMRLAVWTERRRSSGGGGPRSAADQLGSARLSRSRHSQSTPRTRPAAADCPTRRFATTRPHHVLLHRRRRWIRRRIRSRGRRRLDGAVQRVRRRQRRRRSSRRRRRRRAKKAIGQDTSHGDVQLEARDRG